MPTTNLDRIFDAIKTIRQPSEKREQSGDSKGGDIYLVIGLGNPGREYKNTRHNIGFLLMDLLAEHLGVSFTRTQFKSLVTNGWLDNKKIILAKPQTFMNRSGQAVRSLMKFYKIESHQLLVAYDDVDLPFDTIRMKPSGGSGGHKGMQSIIEQLGTQDYPRLRLGVGRPPGYKQAADYVLKPFSKDEADFLQNFIERAADAVKAFVVDGIDPAMTHYNRNTGSS